MQIPGPAITAALVDLGITHVAWLPDSALGPWENAFEQAPFKLIRVCREAEAWSIAAGLHLGGQRPMVVIQNTGLFDSGDALRNVLFDLKFPLLAIVGYRSYLIEDSTDSARRFTEPVLRTWGLDYVLLRSADELPALSGHFRACRDAGKPGVALIAEGRI